MQNKFRQYISIHMSVWVTVSVVPHILFPFDRTIFDYYCSSTFGFATVVCVYVLESVAVKLMCWMWEGIMLLSLFYSHSKTVVNNQPPLSVFVISTHTHTQPRDNPRVSESPASSHFTAWSILTAFHPPFIYQSSQSWKPHLTLMCLECNFRKSNSKCEHNVAHDQNYGFLLFSPVYCY